jgi:pSer/pThr/pTyr-binding forkhead associated (FHA) protein
MWILKGTDEKREEITFRVLPGAAKTVGRSPRADFPLDASLLSRVHCRLTASKANRLAVEDLNSTNGTFVNGRRIKRSALVDGDCIRLGRVELSVKWVEPKG